MNRRRIASRVPARTSLPGLVFGLLLVGCGSSSDATGDGQNVAAPGTDGASGPASTQEGVGEGTEAGGTGASNDSGTAGETGAPSGGSGDVEIAVPLDLLLDDFSDGDGAVEVDGMLGQWLTYSDGTGQVTPPEQMAIVPTDGGITVSGSGFAEWGVGLGLSLADAQGQPVDLSAYRGLTVSASGGGILDVELVLPSTAGVAEGGTCTGEGCFGHYSTTLTLSADVEEHELNFSRFGQPVWAQSSTRDLTSVMGINFLARAETGPASIDFRIEGISLMANDVTPATSTPGVSFGSGAVVTDGSNPFAGRTLHADSGAAFGAYNSAQGDDRELLAKIALNPSAFWVTGDPGLAGSIASRSGDDYPVIVAYNIPGRDCSGESAGGVGDASEYEDWIDAMSSSLAGHEAAVIVEPDALALGCVPNAESLIGYAVSSLRRNPGVAVYIDGGHSNWIGAGDMANRLRGANIAEATGFAVNVSNFQPTQSLMDYGRSLSALVDGKPFVVDTSRNGQGARADWCNPPGAGLGEEPTVNTGDPMVHAFLWVKRPGESDGACGECGGVPAGQFCTDYALELARNAVF